MTEHPRNGDLEPARAADRALEALLAEVGEETRESRSGTRWTKDCPDDVGLWHELALGALDDTQARRFAAHAEVCALCAADRDLARSFARETGELVESLPATEPSPAQTSPESRPLRQGLLALAATVLLGFAGLVWVRTSAPELPPVDAPGTGDAMRSGTDITLVAPVGTIDGLPERLDWNSSVDGVEFQVSVQRVDGSMVFERRTSVPELVLSAAERSALEHDVTYRWSVTAQLDGRRLRTPEQEFVARVAAPEDDL